MTYDLVSRIIVSGAYCLYYLSKESQICCVDISWFSWCIPFWVILTLTLTSDLISRFFLSGAYLLYYPPTKSEGYSFGVVCPSVRLSVHSVRPSVRTFCRSGTISQYLLVRFNSFLVQMISTMNSRYPISLVKIDHLTLELLPLFKYMQL